MTLYNYLKLFQFIKSFPFKRRMNCTEINVIKSKSPDIIIPDQLIDEYVWRNVEKWSNKTAVVCIETGRSYTFEQIYKKTKSLAFNMRRKLGLDARETVAIILPNVPEFTIAFLGAIQAGLKVTTVNPVYTSDEMAKQLKDSGARLIFTLNTLWPTVEKATIMLKQKFQIILTNQVLRPNKEDIPSGFIKLEELCNDDTGEKFHHDLGVDEVVLLPFSSGTTGLSKGVELTHKNVVSNLYQMTSSDFTINFETNAHTQDVIPVFLPFFHIYGMIGIFLNFFSQGCKLITFPKFRKQSFRKLLKVHKPTVMFAVPPIIRLILNNAKIRTEFIDSIRIIVSAAAPLGVLDVERFNDVTRGRITLLQMYGMTESSPLTLMQTLKLQYGAKIGGCGLLLPNTQSKIVSIIDTHVVLGANCLGEILMKGPQVMKGYHNDPTATAAALLPDKWLRTGDVGYYDQDGHFFIVDRLKELIKVRGFQVAPAELEEILRHHPAVEDCAVVGVPHQKRGEVPKAFVVIKQNTMITAQQLCEFVDKKVTNYKRLTGGIVFIPSIPKTPAGKVLRRHLKEL